MFTEYFPLTRYSFLELNKAEFCVMSAATIDRNVLNGLFDNQKRLEDLYDSIFDDDNYFIASSSWQSDSVYPEPRANQSTSPRQGRTRELVLATKEQRRYVFLLPIVLEIAAIYLLVANFL